MTLESAQTGNVETQHPSSIIHHPAPIITREAGRTAFTTPSISRRNSSAATPKLSEASNIQSVNLLSVTSLETYLETNLSVPSPPPGLAERERRHSGTAERRGERGGYLSSPPPGLVERRGERGLCDWLAQRGEGNNNRFKVGHAVDLLES